MSDLIDRRKAIDVIRAMQTYKLFAGDDMILVDKAEVMTELMMLPSAQPERKTGHWLIREGISDAQYSECGMYFNDVYDMENSDAFCRHCGTKMEGLKVAKNE